MFLVTAVAPTRSALADYPKPSLYPTSWELKFEHGKPTRIVVGDHAYWYMTYTVTNTSDREQAYLPMFELLTKDGQVFRSDKNIPKAAFDAIKQREKKQFLEPFTLIGGELRLGEDQAKDGVAIWEEPTARMGQFSIFVGSLSGEATVLKDDKGKEIKSADGKPIIMRKTLQLNYFIRGDEVYPGEDEVNENPEEWVMR